ncbi:4-aminobutyrate aminotransferase-like enzyme [Ruminiclostridium sufflavum DSM 19573]|uniref:4-aminobutyrate aminotransferase-like enzyme n=1 Tax=Ruminiclostridium sufflavum DSM 19573 TaxID=1121337 RepID=A0A318XKJ2_9FIRM|nr:aspartate aminotransferase family protein [Ruminiclostridium sufflavum]PYG87955.1 4-aminobutyrate aminotransferase-like enzyme [Ruminiclostridium sufflavum DSM 19573]
MLKKSSNLQKNLIDVVDMSLKRYVGEGIHLYIDKKEYIDCASGTFNLALGYSAGEITQALHKQLDSCCHLASEYTKEKSRVIFEMLREYLPEHINAFWFRDIIGSTANECAIQIAQKATGKREIISVFLSHHGQSIVSTGVSGNAFRQSYINTPFTGALKIPASDCENCFYGQNKNRCGILCARRLEDFIEYASCGQVAAFILEPILGNGGNIVPHPEYYRLIRKICDKHNILIIADEVQTGFGRTGAFFASNGIAKALKPDIITFAKGAGGIGIPVAGVLMRKELDILNSWEHSTTSGANPLALVAMEETIKYIKKHKVLQNVKKQSVILKNGLLELTKEFPFISNVKGEGLMLAFDMKSSTAATDFIRIAKENGLIMRGSRYGLGNTVKVRPPLIISEEEIEEILERLKAALKQYEEENYESTEV